MDFAYRLLASGGRVNHLPIIEQEIISSNISLVDEFLFIIKRMNAKAAVYAAFWHGLTTLKFRQTLKALRAASTRAKPPQISASIPAKELHTQLVGPLTLQKVGRISAIIPTIGRYDYERLGREIAEAGKEDKDWYLVYGEMKNNWRKLYVKNIKRITR